MGCDMCKYQRGEKILTQKELKKAAKNKEYVWVKLIYLDPSDKFKEMSEPVVPEPMPDDDGFYLGETCWDNGDDDNEKCYIEGLNDTIYIYEAIEKKKTKYSKKMSPKELVEKFLKTLSEETIEDFNTREEIDDFKNELVHMIKSILK